jgi:hypothetical protein
VGAEAASDAEKCESSKLKTTGKYAFCRMKADAKAVKKGAAPDYSNCNFKFGDKFSGAESKYGQECPTSGDEEAIQSQVTADTDALAARLAGGAPTPATCADAGLVDGFCAVVLDFENITLEEIVCGRRDSLDCLFACEINPHFVDVFFPCFPCCLPSFSP